MEFYRELGSEYNKHKHDIVMKSPDGKFTVIEVNYKHGTIAKEKWQIYKTYLEQSGHKTVTIDDDECENILQLKDGKHTDSWGDFVDVINALDNSEVKPL